jgi:hypothetical protein
VASAGVAAGQLQPRQLPVPQAVESLRASPSVASGADDSEDGAAALSAQAVLVKLQRALEAEDEEYAMLKTQVKALTEQLAAQTRKRGVRSAFLRALLENMTSLSANGE